jgi:hypothetical protein
MPAADVICPACFGHLKRSPSLQHGDPFECPLCATEFRIGSGEGKLPARWTRGSDFDALDEQIEDELEVVEDENRVGREPDERRPRRRDEDEGVELEAVEERDDDRPRRRRRRRPRRSGGGFSLPSVNVPLIMLLILGPLGLLIILGAFLTHPITGIASLFMVSGWIWFTLIAAEDSLGTALCVMFVPFYALYYATQNWDRVGFPVLLYLIGTIGMVVGSAMAGKNAPGRRMQGPPAPLVRMLASSRAASGE